MLENIRLNRSRIKFFSWNTQKMDGMWDRSEIRAQKNFSDRDCFQFSRLKYWRRSWRKNVKWKKSKMQMNNNRLQAQQENQQKKSHSDIDVCEENQVYSIQWQAHVSYSLRSSKKNVRQHVNTAKMRRKKNSWVENESGCLQTLNLKIFT